MEIRQNSLSGPVLSVQPLTPPRSSPHTPSRRHHTPSKGSSQVSRKVARCRAEQCGERTQFDSLIDSFHEWLVHHPSPSKHTTLHGELCKCDSDDDGTQFTPTISPDLAEHDIYWDNEHATMEVAIAHYKLSMLSRSLRAWRKELRCRRKSVELADKFFAQSIARRVFQSWRLHICHCTLTRLCDLYIQHKQTTTMQAVLHVWSQRVCVRAGERALLNRLHTLWRTQLLRRVLHVWVTHTRLSMSIQLIRNTHTATLVTSCWSQWRASLQTRRETLRRLDRVRLRRPWERWRLSLHHRCLAHHLHTVTLLRETLLSWREVCLRDGLLKQVRADRERNLIVNCFSRWNKAVGMRLMRRCWCVWRYLFTTRQMQVEIVMRQFNLSTLKHWFTAWRERLLTLTRVKAHCDLLLVGRCFRLWREMVEWSHTQTSMRFIANLQRLLSSDSRVSYSSLVSSLTTVSKNLGLGTLELNGNQRSESSSADEQSSLHVMSHESSSLLPCLCGCLDPEMASDIAEVKQRLTDLSDTLSDKSSREYGGCVICDLSKTTPPSEPTLVAEPPLVIAMATRSIQHLRLHCCSKAFNKWKTYMLECRLETEHVQSYSKWLIRRRIFDRWRQLTTLCRQMEEQALVLWRIQQLSGGWGKWRKSLIVERASRRAVEHHRQLLLKQVFAAWQVASLLGLRENSSQINNKW